MSALLTSHDSFISRTFLHPSTFTTILFRSNFTLTPLFRITKSTVFLGRWEQWHKSAACTSTSLESQTPPSSTQICLSRCSVVKRNKRYPQLRRDFSLLCFRKLSSLSDSRNEEFSSSDTHPLVSYNLICSLLKRVEANTLEELAISSFSNWWCQSITLCFDFNSLRLAAGISVCCAKVIHIQILLVRQILLLQSFIQYIWMVPDLKG